jgi:hypothetical protein
MNRHPSQFSPEVLDVLAGLIRLGEHVHDPYAGPGIRLGQLCDRLGAVFTGGDIEVWSDHDPRVIQADAADPSGYPSRDFTTVTSPVYLNKRLADYPNGPTPFTKIKGRRDYAIALGRALHPDNLARATGRPARAATYWRGHGDAVKQWGDRAIVNVDSPIGQGWQDLLRVDGYTIEDVIPVVTQRYGGLDNADKRADHEVVIVACRTPQT